MEEAGQPACDAPEELRRFDKFLKMEDPLSHLTPSHILPFVKLKEAEIFFRSFNFTQKKDCTWLSRTRLARSGLTIESLVYTRAGLDATIIIIIIHLIIIYLQLVKCLANVN